MALTLFKRKQGKATEGTIRNRRAGASGSKSLDYEPAAAAKLSEDQLQRCLETERYGKVVRRSDHWHNHPHAERAYRTAADAVDDRFCLVPEGFVSLSKMVNDYPGCPEEDVETETFLLMRHAVTNAQFQHFVDDNAYENLELWPQDIWPHLIDFQDMTGQSAPRYWRNGRHDKRLSNHPVVGISYYEAVAYAQWAGYRLPSEAEWQMAASWRIRSSAHVLRRYPWGDALDIRHCNIWASGVGVTVPVDDYPSGAAPNGILQLIGNTWEWTDSNFEVLFDDDRCVIGDMVMKCIRGGAFDTYFSVQATSCFRTGAVCLARVHNIGFRCALDVVGEKAEENVS